MTLQDIHAMLQRQFVEVAAIHGSLPDMSIDTAFALGALLGAISKVKALVGRDIDATGGGE